MTGMAKRDVPGNVSRNNVALLSGKLIMKFPWVELKPSNIIKDDFGNWISNFPT